MLRTANLKEERDMKCREVLSSLLNEQIQKNQELEQENYMLEEEQRRLLNLLQAKMDQSTKQPRNNDSTLQVTEMLGGTSRENLELLEKQRAKLQARIELLQKAVSEKSEDMVRLRDYYTNIIENLEKQNEEEKEQALKSAIEDVAKLKQELLKSGKENDSLQERIAKSSQRIRELSQQLIQTSQLQEKAEKSEKLLVQLRNQQLVLEKRTQSLKDEHQEKMLDQKFQYEQKEMRRMGEAEQKFNNYRRQQQERVKQLKKTQEAQLSQMRREQQQMKREYEERINFIILRSQEQKLQLKEKYQQDAKIVILSELQQNEREQKVKISSLQILVEDLRRKMTLYKERSEEYQTEIQEARSKLSQLQHQKNQIMSKLEKISRQNSFGFQQLQQRVRILKQRCIELEKDNSQLKYEKQALTEERDRLNGENMRLDTQNRKINADNQDLRLLEEQLRDQLTAITETLEEKKQQLKKLATKHTKEIEKRQKIKEEQNRNTKELQAQIQQLLSQKLDLQARAREKQSIFESQIRQMSAKEQKRFKQQLVTVEERVKSQFLQYQKEIESHKVATNQLEESLKNVKAEKENYRRVYQANSNELGKIREKLEKTQSRNQDLQLRLENAEQELEIMRSEMIDRELEIKLRGDLERSKQEITDLRAKLALSQENNAKIKQNISEMASDLVNVNVEREKAEKNNEKLEKKLVNWKNEKEKLEKTIQKLSQQLSDRCEKIESQTPYINTLIDEKSKLESQLQKMMIQSKRKDHMIQVAKRSKAEQLVRLIEQNKRCYSKLESLEQQLKEKSNQVEQLSREKVGSARECSSKDILIRELESKYRQLKKGYDYNRKITEDQEKQLEVLYSIVEKSQMLEE